MGGREVVLQPTSNGRYEGGGGQLSMAGRWQAQVNVRGVGGTAAAQAGSGVDGAARFALTAGQPAGTGRPLFSPARLLLFALTPFTGLGVLILLLAILMFVQRGRIHRHQRRQRLPLALAGATLGLIGLAATGVAFASAYQRSVAIAMPVVNPIAATPESLARGQQLYTQSCMVCHGVTGRGDGPAGRTLRPPPADLRVHMAAGHTDAQLYDWITNGVPGTAMPAWKEQLTPEERWHLVNYLRTFADQASQSQPAPR